MKLPEAQMKPGRVRSVSVRIVVALFSCGMTSAVMASSPESPVIIQNAEPLSQSDFELLVNPAEVAYIEGVSFVESEGRRSASVDISRRSFRVPDVALSAVERVRTSHGPVVGLRDGVYARTVLVRAKLRLGVDRADKLLAVRETTYFEKKGSEILRLSADEYSGRVHPAVMFRNPDGTVTAEHEGGVGPRGVRHPSDIKARMGQSVDHPQNTEPKTPEPAGARRRTK